MAPVPPRLTGNVPEVILAAEWLCSAAAAPKLLLASAAVVAPVPPLAIVKVPEVILAAEWLCEEAAAPILAGVIPKAVLAAEPLVGPVPPLAILRARSISVPPLEILFILFSNFFKATLILSPLAILPVTVLVG